MDEEEELFGGGTLSEALYDAMGGGPAPEAVSAASGILKDYQTRYGGEDQDAPERAFIEQLRKSADARRAVLAGARERLLAQRYNPGEALLAASAALGRPTRTGTLAESMSNVAESVRDPLARRREFSRARDSALSDIELQEAGLDDTVTTAELQLAQLNRRLGTQMAGKALDVLRRTGTGRGNAVREQKIRDAAIQLIEMGMQPREAFNHAVNVVDGNETLEISEDLGSAVIRDKLRRTVREIPIQGAGAPPSGVQAPQPGGSQPQAATATTPLGEPSTDPRDVAMPGRMTLWEAADAGTGLWSGIGAAWNVVGGNVGLPISSETETARQSIRTGAQAMLRALSVDPNDPAAREIDRIRDELNILPTVANNPPVFKDRLRVIDTYMRDMYRRAITDANDTSLSVDMRKSRENLASEIRNFIPALGVPPERPGDEPVPLGIPPDVAEEWQYMDQAGRDLAIRLYGEASPTAATPAAVPQQQPRAVAPASLEPGPLPALPRNEPPPAAPQDVKELWEGLSPEGREIAWRLYGGQ